MLNIQIVRDEIPVSINWNWMTLASLWNKLPEENGLMSTGKYILAEQIAVFDGINDILLKSGDVIKAWR